MALLLVAVFGSTQVSTEAGLITPSSSDSRFGFNVGDAGSTGAVWDVFTDASGPNSPDVFSYGSAVNSTLTETSGNAFLTSGGNLYSFAGATTFTVSFDSTDLSGSTSRIVAQWVTLGTELDYGAITLNGVTATFAEETGRDSVGGFGEQVSYLASWDLGSLAAIDSMELNFAASGAHMSLDQFRVDGFSAVPEPTSLALVGMAVVPLAMRRRRRGNRE